MSTFGWKKAGNDHVTFYMTVVVPGRLNIYFRIAHKFKDYIESNSWYCIESICGIALNVKFKDCIESIFVVLF